MTTLGWIAIIIVGVIFFSGIRIVRPTHRMLVETLGKYSRTAEQGFNWVFPIIQSSRHVNITEQMVDVPEQTVQTSDKLNTLVDAVVYYQIKDVKASQYNVDDHEAQLTSLARTTLRAVMGNMTLTQCIQSRDRINTDVEKVLDKETASYGVEVLRVEVQKIEPPQDVQEAMNNVVKAEQKKIAAADIASALEIEADGIRRAEIKKAEGMKQASILEAEGKAKAFNLINASFKGNAQKLKSMEVTENSLRHNSKVIISEKGIRPQMLIGELPIAKN
jgi:regulator of protease activity HflC (stomatin/prohibitin superfamily)